MTATSEGSATGRRGRCDFCTDRSKSGGAGKAAGGSTSSPKSKSGPESKPRPGDDRFQQLRLFVPLGGYTSISSGFAWKNSPHCRCLRNAQRRECPCAGGNAHPCHKERASHCVSLWRLLRQLCEHQPRWGKSSLHAHMSKRAVGAGQTVQKGQVIGYVGTTGSSTGNHLHFEIKVHGSRINPLSVF